MADAPQEVRCTCSRSPLLARAGIENGKPFLWVRHTKSGKHIVDLKVREGQAEILCRECYRTITVKLGSVMEISRP